MITTQEPKFKTHDWVCYEKYGKLDKIIYIHGFTENEYICQILMSSDERHRFDKFKWRQEYLEKFLEHGGGECRVYRNEKEELGLSYTYLHEKRFKIDQWVKHTALSTKYKVYTRNPCVLQVFCKDFLSFIGMNIPKGAYINPGNIFASELELCEKPTCKELCKYC